VKDEAGVGIQNAGATPYGSTYGADVSTDFRISSIQNPVGVAEYSVNAAAVGTTSDSVTITGHGYTVGQALTIGTAVGATLAAGLNENTQYFAIVPSADTLKFATSVANAGAGIAVVITTTGTDNAAGVQFLLAKDSSPFTYTYTEDANAVPLNNARDFAGGNNFYCTPLSTGDQPNAGLEEIFAMVVVQEGNTRTTAYGSSIEIEFVEPSTEVPDGLFNFDAVTGAVVMSEALRGVNNNGNPQVVVVEKGMDDHSNLFAESQKYSTTQGFLAYYAPYLLNDLGVYVPPTGFVTGFAMKRYRDEIAGFRLPPAGAKYAVAGARGVQVEITTGMQDVSNPYGLNALRQLPGYSETDPDTGITYGPIFIWGSRTRVNPANAEQALYKFVNTRVILNVIYGTLENALDNQIFNIIDGRAVTFNQIRTLVSNTLYSNFYVPGALFGSGAADAFDVVVDDRNNPAANLDNGLVNVQIFVVPVPTLERIEIDLLRVSIGGIKTAQVNLGY
jgi:phage tail sheath protein FI